MKSQRGPDLDASRYPLDKKLYRQILLPNGLRALLISDTLAMQDDPPVLMNGEDYDDDEDEDEESESEEDESNKSEGDKNDDENDDDEDDDEDDGGPRRAAAALIVGAGSFHDPPCVQGMAHFLEHMLFMGTEKYPAENAYDAFLSKNGGDNNAFTELEHTMYHLDIPQEKFFEALDMLAQFFISPLMLPDAVDRELNSIESEFQLSKNADECRLQQLLCHQCLLQGEGDTTAGENKKHPFGNFSWGNIHSLKTVPEENGVDIMTELRRFYNAHYYAQNIGLVVIGAFTLDQLEDQVSKCFSDVPSLPRRNDDEDNSFYDSLAIQRKHAGTWDQTSSTPIQNFGMPFHLSALGHICCSVPVKDRHCLTITWQVPPQWKNWKSKPCDYIAHLLGHESSGSLLSELKDKMWANACYAGVGSSGYENASSHALFSLTFVLSEEGVSHWKEILDVVFIYIGMIRYYCHSESGLPIWIYEELQAIQELTYRFQDEMNPIDLVEDLADSLAPYIALPPERLLDGEHLLFERDADLIKELLDNFMSPRNARVDLISSQFGRAADFEDEGGTPSVSGNTEPVRGIEVSSLSSGEPSVEPIFGTRYWSHPIPISVIEKWSNLAEPQLPPTSSSIKMPPINPFVPKGFDLKPTPSDDTHHPLLFCSLKICIMVNKKKSWFPCTVTKYDGIKNQVLLSYEDEDEKWHKVDIGLPDFKQVTILPRYEGTFDNKSIKFKVIAVPKDGEGAVLKFGDNSDWDVEDGIHFPPIPPAAPNSRLPQLVCDTQLIKLWHLQDRKFKRPIADLRLNIICADGNKSPLHKACADLLAHLCDDIITETSYLASVCELGNSICSSDVGFSVRVNGFDDKLLELAGVILNLFFSFKSFDGELPEGMKASRFEACLETLLRKYGNAGMQASSLCSDVRLRCIRPTIWSAAAKAKAIENLSIPEFLKLTSSLLSMVSVEALYHGNVDRTDTKLAEELIIKVTAGSKSMPRSKYPVQHVMMVPKSKKNHEAIVPTIDPQEPNTAVEVYFQIGKDNVLDRVIVDVLVQMMYEPLYDELRTKEQFGYHVSCGSRWTFGVIGICYKVVTTSKSAVSIVRGQDTTLAP